MADAVDFLFYRGIERWMIVVGGLIFAYLGYRLFLYGVDQGQGKLETDNPFFKVTFSGSGPGLFFMAFGAMILLGSAYSTGDWSSRTTSAPPAAEARPAALAANAAPRQTTTETTLHFSGTVGGAACNHIRLALYDGAVRDALEAYRNSGDAGLAGIGEALERLDDGELAGALPAIEKVLCG